MKIVLILLFLTAVTLASSTNDQEEDDLLDDEEDTDVDEDDVDGDENNGVLERRKRDSRCIPPFDLVRKSLDPSPEQFLDAHEQFRKDGGACGKKRPEWNDALAAMAQATADKCIFEHDGNDKIGQSLYSRSGKLKKAKFAVKKWYEEWKNIGDPKKEKRHFYQLLSSRVTAIGCAVAECSHICKDGQFKAPGKNKRKGKNRRRNRKNRKNNKNLKWQLFVCNYDYALKKGESDYCSCYESGSNNFYKMGKKGKCVKCNPTTEKCGGVSGSVEPVQVQKSVCKDQVPGWCGRQARLCNKSDYIKKVCEKTCGSC